MYNKYYLIVDKWEFRLKNYGVRKIKNYRIFFESYLEYIIR